jgi:hypothetical protein
MECPVQQQGHMPDLTLADARQLANSEELERLLAQLLGGPVRPRPETTRLQPPICIWATYSGAGRWATLKTFFRTADYQAYADQLATHYAERLGVASHPEGGIVLLGASNAVLWAFPFDPVMPGLPACLEGAFIAGALGAEAPLITLPRQYRPEVGALLAYARAPDMAPAAFGKIVPTSTVGTVHAATRRLWDMPARLEGVLRVPRPLAFRPEYGLLLQAPVPGESIGRDRNRAIFCDLVRYAGPALAAIHAADAPFGPERHLDELVARLEHGLVDVALTAPKLVRPLRYLVSQLDRRRSMSATGPRVPSHGDYKYDQFLEHEGTFTLIDFELFCQAEPSLDLGTFCAYLPNTTPGDWREGAAAELLRSEFLAAYEQANGALIDRDRLALYEAAMLGIRALSHVWTWQRDWQVRASQLLDLALERLLNRQS